MVGLQTLDLAIGVRVPASQPNRFVLGQPKSLPVRILKGDQPQVFAPNLSSAMRIQNRDTLPLAKAFESC